MTFGNITERSSIEVFDHWFTFNNITTRQVTGVFDSWFSFGNVTDRTQTGVFDSWFSFGNITSRIKTEIFDYWFSFNNITNRQVNGVFDSWFSFGNVTYREQTSVFDSWMSFGNITERSSIEVFDHWFTFNNITTRQVTGVFDSWMSFGNESLRGQINIFDSWFSFGNITILFLDVSDEHPDNDTSIPYVVPVLYFTINHSFGSLMNYTIYWGDGYNEVVDSGSNLVNGTYYHPFVNATNYTIVYNWSVNLSDGDGHFRNESFSFTSRYENAGMIKKKDMGFVMAFACSFLILGLFIGITIFKKKKE